MVLRIYAYPAPYPWRVPGVSGSAKRRILNRGCGTMHRSRHAPSRIVNPNDAVVPWYSKTFEKEENVEETLPVPRSLPVSRADSVSDGLNSASVLRAGTRWPEAARATASWACHELTSSRCLTASARSLRRRGSARSLRPRRKRRPAAGWKNGEECGGRGARQHRALRCHS